jgi:hypothetical protein
MRNKEKILDELDVLIKNLKQSNNNAYVFFQNIKKELLENNEFSAIEKLKSSYSITQYSNFSFYQENILDKILEMILEEN